MDELPWLATSRSGFLRALGFFWNSWAAQQNVIVIICGSAASWMIQKVVNHKGGLHVINLVEIKFYNQTFTLTKDYAAQLRKKMEVFRQVTKTPKQLFFLLITTFGLQANQHSIGLLMNDLRVEDLFREV